MTSLLAIEQACEAHVAGITAADPAHDISHIKRVVNNTRQLTDIEKADAWVTLPAAWLHDCVQVAKDSPDRARASTLAAEAAAQFLATLDYPEDKLDAVRHAVEAHSYSAAIPVRTTEAGIVQDADRLDALGAIGISRCLLTGGSMGSGLYNPVDPFCAAREPADRDWAVDHFYAKLFKLPSTMQTRAGRLEAERRVAYMRGFLDELGREIGVKPPAAGA
ncbi:HD domain-containing protein [Marinihelvus fidelis]|uniref:HD domain-containing protein n=1 Tax=Marinihelvus fidelis TaxID=2613842 RepID=A0A5N0TDJ7_9GAMM|nr:HD domain-containing protein [Marinihelvus fidelis]KAA9133102.1 HD domain-containing protein [Marinihelvus fidelis]